MRDATPGELAEVVRAAERLLGCLEGHGGDLRCCAGCLLGLDDALRRCPASGRYEGEEGGER